MSVSLPDKKHVDKSFTTRGGNERECLELLKNDYQISAVRLRVWVNPRGGSCGKEEVLAMALRAKKLGMDVMIVETGYEVDERHPEVMEEGRRQLAHVIREARTETNGRCRGVLYWEPQCNSRQYKLGAFDSKGTPTVIMDGFIEK